MTDQHETGFESSPDAYRVRLADGRTIKGLEYAVDAHDDSPTAVRFSAPGRDTKVTTVEEDTAQVEATDD